MLAGIADGSERMRPAETDAVLRRQFLRQECPGAVALPLVLEVEDRVDVTVHHFKDAADRRLGREGVERRNLEGVFVGDVRVECGLLNRVGETSGRSRGTGGELEGRHGRDGASGYAVDTGNVALPVDGDMPLVGDRRVERSVGV